MTTPRPRASTTSTAPDQGQLAELSRQSSAAPGRGQGDRVAALDGFRGIAVLCVVLFHGQTDVFPGAGLGVDLFFVLSGFLITDLLVAEYATHRRIRFGRFYQRRALRLIPGLVALTVVAGIRALAVGDSFRDYLVAAGQALTYTTNLFAAGGHTGPLNPTWSLGVEEQFYILWPALLAVLLSKNRLLRGTAAVLTVLSALHLLAALVLSGSAVFYLPVSRFDQMLCGGLLAVLLRVGRGDLVAKTCGRLAATVSALGLAGLTVVHLPGGLAGYGVRTAIALMGTVLIGQAVSFSRGGWARVLSLTPLVWVGQRSYSIYLFHLLVLDGLVALRLPLRPELSLPLFIGLSLLAGHTSYTVIERPFLRIKARLSTVDHRALAEAVAIRPAQAVQGKQRRERA